MKDLPDVELIEPEGTFLRWLDFRKLDLQPDDLIKFLKDKAGWAVTRGQAFRPQTDRTRYLSLFLAIG